MSLLSRHEGKTLELIKRDLSSPEGVLKAIVAFANTSGGIRVLGVEEGTKKVNSVRAGAGGIMLIHCGSEN